ncbi:hypothetical protein LEP1GSC151_4441 [Leptospira interrogans serovar Grippotyphosa str. LT2186]|uniref:Uncharacterized protein n=1 Tax=Leptospira interrogans serovar Grippotyphosa str. LT2186 TaxID=1001599 RepID=M3H9S0_LEPIR|nr:hypothetical protein LEP1GSC151_4441 [Leptospira interrogans serovar Grippotyphosa str. LT2186]
MVLNNGSLPLNILEKLIQDELLNDQEKNKLELLYDDLLIG